MRLADLVEAVDGWTVPAGGGQGIEIDRIWAGDRISDLLEAASERTLLVTNLASRQLLGLADLMDVPAICVVGGGEPDPEVIRASAERGTVLIVSPVPLFETCGRLFGAMRAAGEGAP